MALNITVAGTIYDSSNTKIDANIQVFVYNKNNSKTKWSDIRTTEDSDYNINIGDPDISSQDNTLGINNVSNEYVLIAVWTQDSDDRNTTASEFAFVVEELSGEDVYLQDIQLNKPDPIECSDWSVTPESIVNDNIIGINNNSNETHYVAFDITHYLYKRFFDINEIIFNYMGASLVEFDFSDGYSTSNVYSPSSAGDLTVKIRVSDSFNNTAECSKITKVYYDIFNCFNTSPESIKTNDTLEIKSCISGTAADSDNVDSVKYIVNGEELNGYDVSLLIEEYGSIDITQVVTYYNGYDTVTQELSRTLTMDNIPPEMSLEVTKDDIITTLYTFTPNGTDVDGTIEHVKYEIYRNNPDSDNNDNYSLYYSTSLIEDLTYQYDFKDLIGQFKIKVTVYDNLGSSTSEEYLLEEISCSDADIYNNFENLDWDKKEYKIEFDISSIKKVWTKNIIKVPWKVETIRDIFDIKPIIIEYQQKINKIDFTYKMTDIGTKGKL